MTVDGKLPVAGIERRVKYIEHTASPVLAQCQLTTASPTTAPAHGAAMGAPPLFQAGPYGGVSPGSGGGYGGGGGGAPVDGGE